MWDTIKHCQFDVICGVPYAGIPIATSIALLHRQPMVMMRKESKNYGTKQMVEGVYKKDDRTIIVDDVVTNGLSKLKAIALLQNIGISVSDIVVLIDREQGAQENLAQKKCKLHSVFTLSEVIEVLRKYNKIDAQTVEKIKNSLQKIPTQDSQATSSKNKILSYTERATLCTNPVAKKLLQLMDQKETNLAVAADVTTKKELLTLANTVGPEICILKTHIDIIIDFDWDLIEQLCAIAKKHNFLIFEDRKFADIGNTVLHQYKDGIYHISEWADMVNAHTISGPGIIEGLKQIGLPKQRGLILLAQMSSKGNLATHDYTKQTITMALEHNDFVIGFIAHEKLTHDPRFIHFTPGINLQQKTDKLGQQYITPEYAINKKSDIIIVGRGIYQEKDPLTAAQRYRKAGWQAYIHCLTNTPAPQ